MEVFVRAEKRPTTSSLMINILIDKVMEGLEEIVEKVLHTSCAYTSIYLYIVIRFFHLVNLSFEKFRLYNYIFENNFMRFPWTKYFYNEK